MSIDKLEALMQLAEHIEKKHDIPFVELAWSQISPNGVCLLHNDKECFYPQVLFTYKEKSNSFHYRLVNDNNYWFRVKKNEETVDNKDVSISLKDKCAPLIEDLKEYLERNKEDSSYSSAAARYNIHALKEIINATEKE